jgi:micrococcal nuclease
MNPSIRKIRKEIKILVSIASLVIVLLGTLVNTQYNISPSKIDNSILVRKQVGQVASTLDQQEGNKKENVNINVEKSFIAEIERVVDGDTVVIRPENSSTTITMRLIGINTPETVDPRKKVECFGKEASGKAKELLVKGTSVRIENDITQNTIDKYGRMLGYIFIPNNPNGLSSSTELFFNKYMIEEGFAYEYTYDKTYIYQKEFREAQIEAKALERGLWSVVNACNGKNTR